MRKKWYWARAGQPIPHVSLPGSSNKNNKCDISTIITELEPGTESCGIGGLDLAHCIQGNWNIEPRKGCQKCQFIKP